jgi:hypothetical protein
VLCILFSVQLIICNSYNMHGFARCLQTSDVLARIEGIMNGHVYYVMPKTSVATGTIRCMTHAEPKIALER